MAKILVVTNDAWFFVSHRLPIAKAVSAAGGNCTVAAKSDESVAAIKSAACEFVDWKIAPRGQTVFGELKTVLSLLRIVREQKPDVIHLITIKAVLYGGIVARLLNVPCCVYAISGLGAIFRKTSTRGRLLRTLIAPFYRFATGHRNSVLLFQNPDDRKQLLNDFGYDINRTRIIRGSGVDVNDYQPTSEPSGVPVVTMAARLLKDKGVSEFVAAATLLKQQGVSARFRIAGDSVAQGNPGAFTEAELQELKDNSVVEFLGHCSDVATLFAQSTIVVLPSYHEGLPKVLLEAGAAGRPIVTTDVPGCRDAIIPNETGLTVPVRDSNALADAIKTLLDDSELRINMGAAGRSFVVNEMGIDAVVEQHIVLYNDLLAQVGLADI